jgi:hypothetical protein
MREKGGATSRPQIVEGPIRGHGKLWKIKIQGGPSGANERLILCRGPIDGRRELTLLYGARELNRQWVPKNALDGAMENYEAVVRDSRRRCPHEPIP